MGPQKPIKHTDLTKVDSDYDDDRYADLRSSLTGDVVAYRGKKVWFQSRLATPLAGVAGMSWYLHDVLGMASFEAATTALGTVVTLALVAAVDNSKDAVKALARVFRKKS